MPDSGNRYTVDPALIISMMTLSFVVTLAILFLSKVPWSWGLGIWMIYWAAAFVLGRPMLWLSCIFLELDRIQIPTGIGNFSFLLWPIAFPFLVMAAPSAWLLRKLFRRSN